MHRPLYIFSSVHVYAHCTVHLYPSLLYMSTIYTLFLLFFTCALCPPYTLFQFSIMYLSLHRTPYFFSSVHVHARYTLFLLFFSCPLCPPYTLVLLFCTCLQYTLFLLFCTCPCTVHLISSLLYMSTVHRIPSLLYLSMHSTPYSFSSVHVYSTPYSFSSVLVHAQYTLFLLFCTCHSTPYSFSSVHVHAQYTLFLIFCTCHSTPYSFSSVHVYSTSYSFSSVHVYSTTYSFSFVSFRPNNSFSFVILIKVKQSKLFLFPDFPAQMLQTNQTMLCRITKQPFTSNIQGYPQKVKLQETIVRNFFSFFFLHSELLVGQKLACFCV